MIAVEKEELQEIVRGVIREEMLKLSMSLTPYVPEDEMKDIEAAVSGKDFKNDDYVDGAAWLGR